VIAAALVIVAAAAALRFWNLGAGIPHNLGQDEPHIINRVLIMMKTGDLNPHFFEWPSLTMYLNLIVGCVTFLAGAMAGSWRHMDFFPIAELYLAGRQFTALVGTATVVVTFAIGRRWGHGVALTAAALMAVIPHHVRESHYVLTDVPTGFFVALTLLLSLRAHEQPSLRRLLWAGATAGLAASCKYNGAIAIVMPMVVVWTSGWTAAIGAGGWSGRFRRTLAVAGVALAAFLAGTPYAIADLPTFLNDYAGLAFTFARDRPGDPGWLIYLKHLLGAMSWPALVLTVAGLLVAAWRIISGPDRVPALVLMTFSLVYFVVMARSFQIYGRYLVPLFAPLSVMAALAAMTAATALGNAFKRRLAAPLAGAAIVVLMLSAPAASSWVMVRDLSRPSTVDLAYQWILANVPANSKVVVESGALWLPEQYQLVVSRSLIDRSLDDYARDGVTYILAASPVFQATIRDPFANRDATVAYRSLLDRATEIAAFDPSATVAGPSIRLYRLPR